jgi:hypothetical protein
MKKLLSVVLAAIMAVSVSVIATIPAMAASSTVVESPQGEPVSNKKPTLMVNGVVNVTDIKYSAQTGEITSVTFTYEGSGTLTGWEENLAELGLVEGNDYNVIYNEDGSITIEFITDAANDEWDNGTVEVNAIVDLPTTATSTSTTKANSSSKAPATGMSTSVVAGSVAVACAGIAVLAATKKKEA